MNNNKVAFVIISNNETLLNECIVYLQNLIIPDGIEAQLMVIKDAKSMLSGMKEARAASDAKYMVFLHQDVFIINPNFVRDIVNIFNSDPDIGMIGMVGTDNLSDDFVMWHGDRYLYLYPVNISCDYTSYNYSVEDGIHNVVAVDGFLIATNRDDIPFRDDLLDGWDFYDISLSMECLKKNYKIVVPKQNNPWCLHDDGVILSLWNYNKYRQIALNEYKDVAKENSLRE